MKQFIAIAALFFVTQSCCFQTGEEIDRVNLPQEARAKIPYVGEQRIPFKHSNGFEFIAETELFINYINVNDNECQDYVGYERRSASFKSNIPSISLGIRLFSFDSDLAADEYQLNISQFNPPNSYFYDTSSPLENIIINNNTYTEVYRYMSSNESSNIKDVLYTESDGFIRIEYRNGEYVEINI